MSAPVSGGEPAAPRGGCSAFQPRHERAGVGRPDQGRGRPALHQSGRRTRGAPGRGRHRPRHARARHAPWPGRAVTSARSPAPWRASRSNGAAAWRFPSFSRSTARRCTTTPTITGWTRGTSSSTTPGRIVHALHGRHHPDAADWGRFSSVQRDLYVAVLRSQLAAIEAIRPRGAVSRRAPAGRAEPGDGPAGDGTACEATWTRRSPRAPTRCSSRTAWATCSASTCTTSRPRGGVRRLRRAGRRSEQFGLRSLRLGARSSRASS